MKSFLTTKTSVLTLLAVLAAGGAAGAIAASSGSGPSNTVKLASSSNTSSAAATSAGSSSTVSTARHRPHVRERKAASADQTVAAAARYLGLSVTQLRAELRTGKTLAQIARETAGRSEAGLVEAVLDSQRAKLAKAGAALPQRVKLQVQVPGGPRPGAVLVGLRRMALAYLGVSPEQLRSDLRAGKSLGQIAASVPGKSEAGLVSALVAVRKAQLERARSGGVLSPAVADARLARAQKTIEGYVRRKRRVRGAATGTAQGSSPSSSSS